MSLINRLTASLVLTGVLLISVLASSNASAVSIPGLTPSGIPLFSNDVTVRINKGKVMIHTNGESKLFTVFTPSPIYGTKGNFSLTTSFNSSNAWTGVGDQLKISGQMDSVGITSKETLVTAELSSFAWDPLQPNILGWNTTNLWCTPDLPFACTTNESLYVVMNTDFDGDFFGAKNFTSSAKALTTVPVPAAVWLFGSGLAFLGATARRRRARKV